MPAKTVSSVGCIFVFEFWGVCVCRKMAQDLLACFSAYWPDFPTEVAGPHQNKHL